MEFRRNDLTLFSVLKQRSGSADAIGVVKMIFKSVTVSEKLDCKLELTKVLKRQTVVGQLVDEKVSLIKITLSSLVSLSFDRNGYFSTRVLTC